MKILFISLIACAISLPISGTAATKKISASTTASDSTMADVIKRMETMQVEINNLQTQLKEYEAQGEVNPETARALKEKGILSHGQLSIGVYGETKVRSRDSAAGRQLKSDPHRIVLLPTYQFSDTIVFNSEIEFEHGGASTSNGSKLFEGGNIEVEQLFVDFKFNEHINWRAPGIDLIPLGFFNLHHEPTLFYSTERPELYRELIPSTWFEMGTSIYGKVVDGLNYQLMVSAGLDDDGDNSSTAGTSSGITGANGIRNARPAIGDFAQANNELGYTFRLGYTPDYVPGLGMSTSAHYSDVTPQRNADNPAVVGNHDVIIYDIEARYRIPKTGFEIRAEYVQIFLEGVRNFAANNNGVSTDNVGSGMYGVSAEVAYHWNLQPKIKNGWELVPFYRYSTMDLQSGGYSGTDAHAPTGQGDREFHTFGLAAFPTPELVLKADYRLALDESISGPQSDQVQFAVGFFF